MTRVKKWQIFQFQTFLRLLVFIKKICKKENLKGKKRYREAIIYVIQIACELSEFVDIISKGLV